MSDQKEPYQPSIGYPRTTRQLVYPWWVRFGLWGSRTRATMMLWVWLSILLTLFCVGAGFLVPGFWFGTLLILAVVPYGAAIRWMDQHDGWEQRKKENIWEP